MAFQLDFRTYEPRNSYCIPGGFKSKPFLNSLLKGVSQNRKFCNWILSWRIHFRRQKWSAECWAGQLGLQSLVKQKRENGKITNLSTPFNAMFSLRIWDFHNNRLDLFSSSFPTSYLKHHCLKCLLHYEHEMPDCRSFLFCISSKKDVRNLSLEDIFHFLLCTFACYEIFGRKSERYHIRGCICIWCCLGEYSIHLLPELKISWHI